MAGGHFQFELACSMFHFEIATGTRQIVIVVSIFHFEKVWISFANVMEHMPKDWWILLNMIIYAFRLIHVVCKKVVRRPAYHLLLQFI